MQHYRVELNKKVPKQLIGQGKAKIISKKKRMRAMDLATNIRLEFRKVYPII